MQGIRFMAFPCILVFLKRGGFYLMSIGQVILRALLAVIIGGLIGTERARHGRAAGMRTHILVCLGAMLTAMIGVYANTTFGVGDITRIAAQVVSGVGFLGAGMIILKNGNVITGLTTAAGVWTTATIGMALGYGFYTGAIVVAGLFLSTVILFAKLERRKKSFEIVYVECDNMYRLNNLMEEFKTVIKTDYSTHIVPSKSGKDGNIGIHIVINGSSLSNFDDLLKLESVVYVTDEQ